MKTTSPLVVSFGTLVIRL